MYRNWQKISCFVGRFYVNSFFLEQTDVLKQTHIVITDNQVAETLVHCFILIKYECSIIVFKPKIKMSESHRFGLGPIMSTWLGKQTVTACNIYMHVTLQQKGIKQHILKSKRKRKTDLWLHRPKRLRTTDKILTNKNKEKQKK
jgi:hypothetical protein